VHQLTSENIEVLYLDCKIQQKTNKILLILTSFSIFKALSNAETDKNAERGVDTSSIHQVYFGD